MSGHWRVYLSAGWCCSAEASETINLERETPALSYGRKQPDVVD